MELVGKVAWWLAVLGAINWGLVGLLNLNIVEAIFGAGQAITQMVYILVGVSGAYVLLTSLSKR